MDDPDRLARLRAEEIAEELAIGKEERRMAHKEREMERELKKLEDAERQTELEEEREWRREHSGHEPERPPVWPTDRER